MILLIHVHVASVTEYHFQVQANTMVSISNITYYEIVNWSEYAFFRIIKIITNDLHLSKKKHGSDLFQ